MRDSIIFIIAALFIVGGLVFTFKSWSDCNDQGGEYVKGLNGLYKCVQVVQEK